MSPLILCIPTLGDPAVVNHAGIHRGEPQEAVPRFSTRARPVKEQGRWRRVFAATTTVWCVTVEDE
eukprot:112404-Amphidinium_carterae.1